MSLHYELKRRIELRFNDLIDGEVQLLQDALQVSFDTGLSMEMRYLNQNEYSIKWIWGEAELCIDTAPLHKDLPTFPNHLHDADENVRADTVTTPGREPWENISHLIDTLIHDPLLQSN